MGLRGRRGGRVRLERVWCISELIYIWVYDCMSAIVVSENICKATTGLWVEF